MNTLPVLTLAADKFLSQFLTRSKIFQPFTPSINNAITYLKENNINLVAMKSTGVYWVTLYDMLE